MNLNSSINLLPKTSSITLRRLRTIGVDTFQHLLEYFPARYLDFSLVSKINKIQSGEILTVIGKIIKTQNQYTKTGLKIQKVTIADDSGQIDAIWYNQPYLIRLFKIGDQLAIGGITQEFGKKLFIQPQEYQLGNGQIHTGRIIPVYPEKQGLSSRVIREKIFWLINQIKKIDDPLPKKIINYNHLIDRLTAYKNIHFPQNKKIIEEARMRLSFDELFILQLSNSLIKKDWEREIVGNPFLIEQQKVDQFVENLPFRLTNGQKKVVAEILRDLSLKKPMNRFLQGDVGSGKTVVATIACYLAYLNGYQSLFMAPTEILAKQHYETISSLLKPYKIKVGLQTRSKKILNFDLIIGTHALLNEKLKFNNVGLVIVDEQHRFGVNQRALLQKKAINPHLLTMTATPIPRTVALTLYGQLDISSIDEMPKDRLPVKTFYVNQEKRADGYNWIKKQIEDKAGQVFIVCPLIEQSQSETLKSVKAAQKEYQYLKNNVFSKFQVGLLHGRMKSKEKEKVMTDFKDKKIDILIATSVVEVGIDISNATIMIIEGAERYGLAGLHQLRGRVGRGAKQSYCFLFTENSEEDIIKRLRFFAKTNSGQQLAEYDFRHRGPGTIFGTKQHGFLKLKIASLTNFDLIRQTKSAINYFISHYKISRYKLLGQQIKNFQATLVTNN